MIECLFLSFLIMLVIGVPISISLALASAAAMYGYSNFSLDVIVQKFFSASNSFPLVAVPFFVLAGNIMSKGGMSDRLIKLALSIVGNVRGGLAMVSVTACMFFASVSGSTAATTAAIGIVLVPAIIKTGFSPGAATSLQATAGSIGIIIPPSLPLHFHWRAVSRRSGAGDNYWSVTYGRCSPDGPYPEASSVGRKS